MLAVGLLLPGNVDPQDVDGEPWAGETTYVEWSPPGPAPPGGYATEPPSRWPGLRAELDLPNTVTPGATIEYVVRLSNITAEAVDLRPCGGFRQEVEVVGAGMAAVPVVGGRSEFRLSCDGHPRLAAGETHGFAMKLVLPGDIAGDSVLFTWGFVDDMPDYAAQEWVSTRASARQAPLRGSTRPSVGAALVACGLLRGWGGGSGCGC